MNPMLILPAIQAGLSAYQLIQGGIEKKRAGERPDMPIPPAATQALNLARNRAGQRNMAGYDQALAEIDRSTGNTSAAIKSQATSADQAIEGSLLANANALGAKGQLGVVNAQDYDNRQANLEGALNRYSNLEMAKWDWDKRQKWQEAMGVGSALTGAGLQNLYGAADTGVSIGMLDKMYGGQQPATPQGQTFLGSDKSANVPGMPQDVNGLLDFLANFQGRPANAWQYDQDMMYAPK